jgi:YVTN family beta-propeller protein
MDTILVGTPLRLGSASKPCTFSDGVTIRGIQPILWELSVAKQLMSDEERKRLSYAPYWLCASKEVNSTTNKIYVANNGTVGTMPGTVTVIDGATNNTTTVSAGTNPRAVAVNAVTNKIYVANEGSQNVTIIDGSTNNTTTVTAGVFPKAVAVNSSTDEIYVVNNGDAGSVPGTVTVIDGGTNQTTTVNVGTGPEAVALNEGTDFIYVSNTQSSDVTVIDGKSNSTTTA